MSFAYETGYEPKLWLGESQFFVQTSPKSIKSVSMVKLNPKLSKITTFPVDITVTGKVYSKDSLVVNYPDPEAKNNTIFAILDTSDSKSAGSRLINPYSIPVKEEVAANNEQEQMGVFYIESMASAFIASNLGKTDDFKIAVLPTVNPVIYMKLESPLPELRMFRSSEPVDFKVKFEQVSFSENFKIDGFEVDFSVVPSYPDGIKAPYVKFTKFVRLIPKKNTVFNIEKNLSLKGNVLDLELESKTKVINPDILKVNKRLKYTQKVSYFNQEVLKGYKIFEDLVFAWSRNELKVLTFNWDDSIAQLASVSINLSEIHILDYSLGKRKNGGRNLIVALIGQQADTYGYSLVLLKIKSTVQVTTFLPGLGILKDLTLVKVKTSDVGLG
jgi:hypothetical protein